MSLLTKERQRFLGLIHDQIVHLAKDGKHGSTPNFADSDNRKSVLLARLIEEALPQSAAKDPIKGQTAGALFEQNVREFISRTLPQMNTIRPGKWKVWNKTEDAADKVSDVSSFIQYQHLSLLGNLVEQDQNLRSVIGLDYITKPDVLVGRLPEPDEDINRLKKIVDNKTAGKAHLRKVNNQFPILHASISCKWTMRSDRSQNSRTEALNLLRNRKGRSPHIMVVTMEPLPSRIASIALGTGDIDCTYHSALYELLVATKSLVKAESIESDDLETLEGLISTDRLKDISDLPLDLAI